MPCAARGATTTEKLPFEPDPVYTGGGKLVLPLSIHASRASCIGMLQGDTGETDRSALPRHHRYYEYGGVKTWYPPGKKLVP